MGDIGKALTYLGKCALPEPWEVPEPSPGPVPRLLARGANRRLPRTRLVLLGAHLQTLGGVAVLCCVVYWVFCLYVYLFHLLSLKKNCFQKLDWTQAKGTDLSNYTWEGESFSKLFGKVWKRTEFYSLQKQKKKESQRSKKKTQPLPPNQKKQKTNKPGGRGRIWFLEFSCYNDQIPNSQQ